MIKTNFLAEFIRGFAWQENSSAIFAMSAKKNSLLSVNGLKAISALWVFGFHCYFYALASTSNVIPFFVYADSLLMQPFITAMTAVDVFFILGGFLLSYNFYEWHKKNPTRNLVAYTVKKIITRYLRYFPCLMAVSWIIILRLMNYKLRALPHLLGADFVCGHRHLPERHIAIHSSGGYRGKLQEILVEKSSRHPQSLPVFGDVHDVELVCGSWFSALCHCQHLISPLDQVSIFNEELWTKKWTLLSTLSDTRK